jgi:hypothetical protein
VRDASASVTQPSLATPLESWANLTKASTPRANLAGS